jgi:hypothetical protein
MSTKINASHITKFDGPYFDIHKHRLMLIFKAKKLWPLVNGTKPKPMTPTTPQIAIGTHSLLAIGVSIINAWEEGYVISLTLISNCLDNIVISHVQSCTTARLTWTKLTKLFESQDVVTNIYLKDKLHTLKMKEINSVKKHIHIFRAHLEHLLIVGTTILDDKIVLTLMRNASKLSDFY